NRRAEAQILGNLGVALARQGRIGPARDHLQAGLQVLRAGTDKLSLGLVLCGLAEVEWLDGQSAAAARAMEEAQSLTQAAQAGPASELGLAVARLQRLLSAPAA
ncbi:MAG: tetratricopeptide repeat protein, partial [Rubrivivax sp.]|nr:tetratricopeptide repeat protein [Rubrivivax sp.]